MVRMILFSPSPLHLFSLSFLFRLIFTLVKMDGLKIIGFSSRAPENQNVVILRCLAEGGKEMY